MLLDQINQEIDIESAAQGQPSSGQTPAHTSPEQPLALQMNHLCLPGQKGTQSRRTSLGQGARTEENGTFACESFLEIKNSLKAKLLQEVRVKQDDVCEDDKKSLNYLAGLATALLRSPDQSYSEHVYSTPQK